MDVLNFEHQAIQVEMWQVGGRQKSGAGSQQRWVCDRNVGAAGVRWDWVWGRAVICLFSRASTIACLLSAGSVMVNKADRTPALQELAFGWGGASRKAHNK